MKWKGVLLFGMLVMIKVATAQKLDTIPNKSHSIEANEAKLLVDSPYLKVDSPPNPEQIYLKGPINTIGRFGDAIIYTWAAPLRWKKRDWLTAGTVVAATALLFIADKPINKFWERQHSGFLNTIKDIGYHSGKPYAAIISMSGFYVAGVVFKSDWAKETAMILGSSYLSSGALQSIVKTAVGRARPEMGKGNLTFKPFSSEPGYHSFPSGHIQIAMTTATVLANRVKNPYLQTFFYATAATTFISRMYSHSHWVSDLFMGGVTSWYMAKVNIKRWKMTSTQAPFTGMLAKKPKLVWNMGATSDGIGIVGHF